jgi:hypothetical protein
MSRIRRSSAGEIRGTRRWVIHNIFKIDGK